MTEHRWIVALPPIVALALILFLLGLGCIGSRSVSAQSYGFIRPDAVAVWTDSETGCDYLIAGGGRNQGVGLTLRRDRTGRPMCPGVPMKGDDDD